MKPIHAPQVPGKTEFERFDNALRRVLSVPRSRAEDQKKSVRDQPTIACKQSSK